MKKSSRLKYKKCVVALVLSATMFIACHDDKTKISSINNDKHVPTLEIDSLNINYSESGLLRMNLQAPLMQRFMLADEPYSEFNKGIHIYFYTPAHELESEIIADYALNKEKPEEMWKAIGNVVIINHANQRTLYTDTLYWNRAQKKIYTDAPVRIVTPDGDIKGIEGMTSDERFTDYEIRNVNDSPIYVTDEPTEQDNSSTQITTPVNVSASPTSQASAAIPIDPNLFIQKKPVLQKDSTAKKNMFRQKTHRPFSTNGTPIK